MDLNTIGVAVLVTSTAVDCLDLLVLRRRQGSSLPRARALNWQTVVARAIVVTVFLCCMLYLIWPPARYPHWRDFSLLIFLYGLSLNCMLSTWSRHARAPVHRQENSAA
jgi:hypothetical protein